MAVTLKQTEAAAAYPAAPGGLSEEAAAIDAAVIWDRLFSHIAYRWTERAVTWIAEGPGEWVPTLAPATLASVEIWTDRGWETAEPAASPLGGYCLDMGMYRITGTVGGGTLPEALNEAYRRLAEYFAGERESDKMGASKFSTSIGSISLSVERNPAWMARAMQNSGAADLLRPYRRAPGC